MPSNSAKIPDYQMHLKFKLKSKMPKPFYFYLLKVQERDTPSGYQIAQYMGGQWLAEGTGKEVPHKNIVSVIQTLKYPNNKPYSF